MTERGIAAPLSCLGASDRHPDELDSRTATPADYRYGFFTESLTTSFACLPAFVKSW